MKNIGSFQLYVGTVYKKFGYFLFVIQPAATHEKTQRPKYASST